MIRTLFFVTSIVLAVLTPAAWAQVDNFTPVTQEMLLNPSPGDWLMFSRTYDSQRFSPLDQINRQNVGQLRMAWVRGMGPGIHENIPIVHQGVMYVANPEAVVQALDATNGDLIWEYRRSLPEDLSEFIRNAGRARAVAIYEDLIFFTAPDGYLVGLDARTGELRWETMVQDYKSYMQHTSGPLVVEGKVITGRSCPEPGARCFIAAHDALTGKELWRFHTAPAPGEPGGIWVLDRDQGQFLWSSPFPFDTPYFHVSDIDVETGRTYINRDQVLKEDGERHLICYSNTKSYWPMAYHPGKNSLYIPYFDVCVDRTGDLQREDGHVRTTIPRPGSDPNALAGIAKVSMTTGQIQRFLHDACSREWRHAGHSRRADFLGRYQSKVESFRCRQWRNSLENNSGGNHSK